MEAPRCRNSSQGMDLVHKPAESLRHWAVSMRHRRWRGSYLLLGLCVCGQARQQLQAFIPTPLVQGCLEGTHMAWLHLHALHSRQLVRMCSFKRAMQPCYRCSWQILCSPLQLGWGQAWQMLTGRKVASDAARVGQCRAMNFDAGLSVHGRQPF